MGAIADGNFKKYGYGTGDGQIDIARETRIANQGKVSTAEAFANFGTSVFLTLTSKIAEGGSSNSDNVSEEATPEEIQAKREEVLKELNGQSPDYQCDCVGDIEALILDKNNQLSQANEQVATLTKTISENNIKIEDFSNKIADKRAEINLTKGGNADGEPVDTTKLQQELDSLIKEKEKLEKENKRIEENELKTAKELQVNIPKEISSLEKSKQALANLDKQLEKANKKDAVKKWDDESTQDIIGLLKRYNELKSAGKTKKAEELKQGDLQNAIEAYQQSHKAGDNKTIDNLIALVNKK